jgi:hypothetical protein
MKRRASLEFERGQFWINSSDIELCHAFASVHMPFKVNIFFVGVTRAVETAQFLLELERY